MSLNVSIFYRIELLLYLFHSRLRRPAVTAELLESTNLSGQNITSLCLIQGILFEIGSVPAVPKCAEKSIVKVGTRSVSWNYRRVSKRVVCLLFVPLQPEGQVTVPWWQALLSKYSLLTYWCLQRHLSHKCIRACTHVTAFLRDKAWRSTSSIWCKG